MPNLNTSYMGLSLANPLVAGSSTHTITADRVKALEDAGIGAVVLKSIFEEQIRSDVSGMVDSLRDDPHAEAYEYLRADYPMQVGPEKYLDRVREIKAAASIPIIASVNCIDGDRWVSFARKIESAGADGIELNVYDVPQDAEVVAADVEQRHLDLVSAVASELSIPVAVKIGPYYSSISNFVVRLAALDIEAIVMFNRFFQPDIDIDGMALKSGINFSRSEDIRLAVRWIAMLRNRVTRDLALTGGVHDAEGAIKALLAGANVVQICSVLYQQGNECVPEILKGIREWMAAKQFATIDDFRGKLSEPEDGESAGFARAQYVKAFVGLE
jgi:dihydroorotate dehydrogenase (fumarate)